MDAYIPMLIRILAVVTLCAGLWNVCLLLMFRREKHRSSTAARLVDVKSRKNVRVRTRGPKSPVVIVPHSSTGTYLYTVSGKDYRIKGWQHVAPGKLPKQPRVVYLTRFPKHAYLEGELMYLPEILRAFLLLMTGICFWMIDYAIASGMIVL